MRERKPVFLSNMHRCMTRPDFTGAWWLGEKGKGEKSWASPRLPPDHVALQCAGPLPSCCFPPSATEARYICFTIQVLPISGESNKVRKIVQNKLLFSYFSVRGLSMQDDFNVVLCLGGKFLFTGRVTLANKSFLFLILSFSYLVFACSKQLKRERKVVMLFNMYVSNYHLAQGAARTENIKI